MRHVTVIVEWILCAGAVTRAAALISGCDGVGSALCRLALGGCLSLARWLVDALRAGRAARDVRVLLTLAEAAGHGR